MTRQRQLNETQKRDIFGRNYSYLWSCLPHIDELDTIDPYSYDLESGYTPLHVALKLGYLEKAFRLYKHWKDDVEYLSYKFGGHLLDQIDREGLTPLDLYSLELEVPARRFPQILGYCMAESNDKSLALWGERPLDQNSFGSYVLTWGSNVNCQLGTGTKDDRRNLFQLSIDQLENNGYLPSRERFKQVFMRRYHALILTTNNKIYTCGSGSRGRLNNDTIESSLSTFTEVWNLKDSKVKMIASSDHHTLVLVDDGAVYSWGWNAYGQAGQSLSRKSKDQNVNKITVPSPKRINFLDNQYIEYVACSKVHSCAATVSGNVIMWGLNLGQMGTSKPAYSTPDLQYHNEDGYIVDTPVVVKLPSDRIEQIVCTEMATFIRARGNTLYVLSGYRIRTFKIPLPKSRHYKEIDAFKHFTPRKISLEVIDMKCNNRFGNNICFLYRSGRIGIINWKEDNIKMWSKMPNTLPVMLYWTPNLRSKRGLDFDVSSRGQLVVCTISGDVYTINGLNSRPEKIQSNKLNSGRAVAVSCDSSFASFITVKSEFSEIPMIYPKDTLYLDFSQYSPLRGRSAPLRGRSGNRRNAILGLLNESQVHHGDYLSNHEFTGDPKEDEKNSELRMIKTNGSSLLDFDNSRTALLSQDKILEEANFDVTFIDAQTRSEVCYCHKLLLHRRCGNFTRLIAESGRYVSRNSSFEFVLRGHIDASNWIIEVEAEKDVSGTLREIIHFLYTDERQFGQNASKLFFDFVDNSHNLARLPISLQELWTHRASDSYPQVTNADVRFYLCDGIIEGHSLVLSTRSIFCRTILSKDWLSTDEDGYAIIDLRMITTAKKNHLEFILRYIYGMDYADLCCHLTQRHLTGYLQFFLDVLELSDILGLESFKNFLETLIANYINGETVIAILLNAVYYNCQLLVFNCCWFLCNHVKILFSKENIEIINENFDSEIWQSLEDVLKQMRNSSVCIQDNTSWYYNNTFDWLGLFRKNIRSFNDHFVDFKHPFIPVFGLKPPEKENKQRTKSSNGSTHAVHVGRHSKTRKSSVEKEGLKKFSQSDVDRKGILTDNNDDESAIDDTDHFIEVIKGRKRTSSSRHSGTEPVNTHETPAGGSKIVIHSPQEEANSDLPSLAAVSNRALSPHNGDQTIDVDTSTAKMNGVFKKNSQKERLKHVIAEKEGKLPIHDQKAWKKTSGTKFHQCPSTSSSASALNNLPSLYDVNSNVSLSISKKEKKKNLKPIPNTEFISHGNLGGISPYLQKSIVKKTKEKTEDNPVPLPSSASPAMTLQEKLEAQQFEIWFAEQSKNVQEELRKKKKKNSLVRDLDVVYNAAQTLPDFVQRPEGRTKKCKKKLKLKFESRQT